MPPTPCKDVGDEPIIELEHAIGYSALRGGLHYHPNGREYVYAAGASIVVADFNDAHEQTFLRGHDDAITCVALSPRGRFVCSGQRGRNADALVWDFETKRLLYRLAEHDHVVLSVAFSDDEKLLITAGDVDDGKLIVWDLATGCKVATVALDRTAPTVCVQFGGFVRDLKRRDTADYLFCTCAGTKLTLWALNPYTGECKGERVSCEGRGTTVREMQWVAFSDDKETVYCATRSGDFCLVNVRKRCFAGGGTTVFAAKQGIDAILALPGGQGVLCGGGDGTVTWFDERLHDVAQAKLSGAVVAMSYSPDRSEVICGVAGGAVYRLRADLSAVLLLCENHAGGVMAVAYAAESSERFASASVDRSIRIWDANDYKCATQVHARDCGAPACVQYTVDFLISGWTDGRIRAHDAESGAALWLIDHAHRAGVTALQMAHNGRFILSGGQDGDVRVWELRSRELVSHLKEHRAAVTAVAMYDDDAHALSCSRDRSFLCWDLRREKRMTSHTQRMGAINAIALSRDETAVFTVGQEKRLTRWDLRDHEPVEDQVLDPRENDDEAMCVAVSKSGSVVATAGTAKVLKLFSTAPGHPCLASIQGHSGKITDLKFSPDDKQLVTVGEDGVIFVWNLFLD